MRADEKKTPLPARDPTLDVLRGLTIAVVTAYHFHADCRGLDLPVDPARAFAAALGALDLRGALGSIALTLVAAPAYRLDLFLFVTGVVLTRSPRRGWLDFLRRRARDVLPNYWMGSVLVAAVLVLAAGARSLVLHTPLADEIHHGTRLARQPYLFEAADLARSLSVVGRFADLRSFQVVAPSMWYVMLLLQAYVLFAGLRALRDRLGAAPFCALVLGFTWLGRAWVFRVDPLPSFGPNPTVLYFIPFRLAPVALGMAASELLSRIRLEPRRSIAYALAPLALLWLVATFWLAADANRPGTVAGVIGPVVPLALGIAPLWWLASTARSTAGVGTMLAWAGRHSLSILVMQDVLRLGVGTWQSLVGALDRWFWPGLVPYLALSAVLARLWEPLVVRARARFWPPP